MRIAKMIKKGTPNIDALVNALKYHSFDMRQDNDGSMVRELFVLYYSSDKPHWWERFLQKGYEHCGLVTYDGYEYTFVSHGISFNFQQVLPLEHDCGDSAMLDWIKNTLDLDSLIVQKVCCTIKPVNRLKFPVVIDSCVENVKRYLGIGKRSIMTPYQLHNHLNNIGAVKHAQHT